ncbi:FecR domain-containing protein [Candidatus Latescibacterota bacterium]
MIKGKLITTHNYRKLVMERKYWLLKIIIQLLLLFSFVSGTAYTQEQDQVAMIYRINGTLEYRESAADDWVNGKPKTPLYNGNQLRTGTGDKAIVFYNTGTRVLINENTTIEIQAEVETAGGKPTVERTRLILGEIYNRAKGNYEVETPSSVASVRGTEFDALTDGDTDTYVGYEGLIEIMNQFGSVLLRQLQMSTVGKGEAPGEPTDISQGDADKRREWIKGVTPTWKLNIIPEGGTNQQLAGVFTLTIQALKEGYVIDTDATFALTEFTTDSSAIEFSTDSGKTWSSDPPQITLLNGQASLSARITQEATVNITAGAEDAETALLAISATQPKGKKTLELMFTDPDGGGEKTMTWELEEK